MGRRGKEFQRGKVDGFWSSTPRPPPKSGIVQGALEDLVSPGHTQRQEKKRSEYFAGFGESRRWKKGR